MESFLDSESWEPCSRRYRSAQVWTALSRAGAQRQRLLAGWAETAGWHKLSNTEKHRLSKIKLGAQAQNHGILDAKLLQRLVTLVTPPASFKSSGFKSSRRRLWGASGGVPSFPRIATAANYSCDPCSDSTSRSTQWGLWMKENDQSILENLSKMIWCFNPDQFFCFWFFFTL